MEPSLMTCENHTPHPEGYLEHGEWAEGMADTHCQVPCPDCGLWVIWVANSEILRLDWSMHLPPVRSCVKLPDGRAGLVISTYADRSRRIYSVDVYLLKLGGELKYGYVDPEVAR